MSSGVTEFLDYNGPVPVDKTVTRSGVKWNNTTPVGQVKKTPVSIVIPAVPLTNLGFSWNGIGVQFNYTAPQPFSLLDWNSVINQAAYSTIGLFFAIRYRVGNVATRYRLTGNLPIVAFPNRGGVCVTPAPLYAGQLIQPQFVIEAWVNLFSRLSFIINFPIIIQTSILNTPSPFPCQAAVQLAPIINGTQTSNLFLNTPVPIPMQFNASGPWNSN